LRGLPVEEFELRFIDGESIDAKLFEALGVNQGNFAAFLEAAEDWSNDDKIKMIIAIGEIGYKFDLGKDSPDQFDVDLYEMDCLRDLAVQFVEEGLSAPFPHPSRITWIMTPSPAIWAWITAKSRLTAPAIFTAAINQTAFSKVAAQAAFIHGHLLRASPRRLRSHPSGIPHWCRAIRFVVLWQRRDGGVVTFRVS